IKQENDNPIYLPLKPDYQITVSEVVQSIDSKGINQLPFNPTKDLILSTQIIEKIENTIQQNFGQILIKDIIKKIE
ncbi:MAG: hypothetical protein N2203_08735, partial [Bacteroidia bacterium]|nr:hypothetical protein [Bacteroidia bacterium]